MVKDWEELCIKYFQGTVQFNRVMRKKVGGVGILDWLNFSIVCCVYRVNLFVFIYFGIWCVSDTLGKYMYELI